MKSSPTLICIPDISGFTKFMSEIDFELSSRVIPSLLNNIIYSNEIGLKVSEIEGDAVLFYKPGKLPPFGVLVDQCRYFYSEFYEQIKMLRQEHSGKEGASAIPEILGLKIILHFGKEVAPVQVGNRIKLLGEDVIVAHRLLKNKIAIQEYLLFSEALLGQYADEVILQKLSDPKLISVEEDYPDIGKINYKYLPFEPPLG